MEDANTTEFITKLESHQRELLLCKRLFEQTCKDLNDILVKLDNEIKSTNECIDSMEENISNLRVVPRNIDGECYVYFIKAHETNMIKIGISKNPHERLKDLRTSNGATLEIIKTIKCNTRYQAIACEGKLHKYYKDFNLNEKSMNCVGSEWFDSKIENDKLLHGKKSILHFESFSDVWNLEI